MDESCYSGATTTCSSHSSISKRSNNKIVISRHEDEEHQRIATRIYRRASIETTDRYRKALQPRTPTLRGRDKVLGFGYEHEEEDDVYQDLNNDSNTYAPDPIVQRLYDSIAGVITPSYSSSSSEEEVVEENSKATTENTQKETRSDESIKNEHLNLDDKTEQIKEAQEEEILEEDMNEDTGNEMTIDDDDYDEMASCEAPVANKIDREEEDIVKQMQVTSLEEDEGKMNSRSIESTQDDDEYQHFTFAEREMWVTNEEEVLSEEEPAIKEAMSTDVSEEEEDQSPRALGIMPLSTSIPRNEDKKKSISSRRAISPSFAVKPKVPVTQPTTEESKHSNKSTAAVFDVDNSNPGSVQQMRLQILGRLENQEKSQAVSRQEPPVTAKPAKSLTSTKRDVALAEVKNIASSQSSNEEMRQSYSPMGIASSPFARESRHPPPEGYLDSPVASEDSNEKLDDVVPSEVIVNKKAKQSQKVLEKIKLYSSPNYNNNNTLNENDAEVTKPKNQSKATPGGKESPVKRKSNSRFTKPNLYISTQHTPTKSHKISAPQSTTPLSKVQQYRMQIENSQNSTTVDNRDAASCRSLSSVRSTPKSITTIQTMPKVFPSSSIQGKPESPSSFVKPDTTYRSFEHRSANRNVYEKLLADKQKRKSISPAGKMFHVTPTPPPKIIRQHHAMDEENEEKNENQSISSAIRSKWDQATREAAPEDDDDDKPSSLYSQYLPVKQKQTTDSWRNNQESMVEVAPDDESVEVSLRPTKKKWNMTTPTRSTTQNSYQKKAPYSIQTDLPADTIIYTTSPLNNNRAVEKPVARQTNTPTPKVSQLVKQFESTVTYEL